MKILKKSIQTKMHGNLAPKGSSEIKQIDKIYNCSYRNLIKKQTITYKA